MITKRSALGTPPIATMIACLVLAACSAGTRTSPPSPTQGGRETTVPTGTATLEAAPAFVRGDVIHVLPGEKMGLAVADLNLDGKPDLVTTTQSRLGVVVLLGRGDGTFAVGPDIEVAPASAVSAADLNGDGHVDLVAAGDKLAVLLGKGDGTFAQPVYYSAGAQLNDPGLDLYGLHVADLNADSIPDLVAANWVASQLAVLLGKGDGTFEAASLYSCPHCQAPAAVDLDRDGNVDVVATSFSPGSKGMVYVFLNDGGGHLREPVAYDPGGSATAIALGDLNGDGAMDVVTGNDQSYSLSVLLGRGDGTFAQAQAYPAGNTFTVAVLDMNGDGKLDVLGGSWEHTKVWFYRGTGDGTLIETQGIHTAPSVALSLAVADFNGDGKLDLALAESGSDHSLVSIFLGA
jgi:hypothetical protein